MRLGLLEIINISIFPTNALMRLVLQVPQLFLMEHGTKIRLNASERLKYTPNLSICLRNMHFMHMQLPDPIMIPG